MNDSRQTNICTLKDGWKAVCKPAASWADDRIPPLLYVLRSPHIPRCLGLAVPSNQEENTIDLRLSANAACLPLQALEPPVAEGCFLFEYLEGLTLRQVNRKDMTSLELERWFDQILGALSWMMICTRKPFAHLDLSPENILISPAGSAALIDFSGSRFLDGQASLPDTSRVATAGYAAPEVYFGDICPETDLYGLAMTILAVYSGQTASSLTRSTTRATLKRLERAFSERLRLCLSDDPLIRRRAVAGTSYEHALSVVAADQQKVRALPSPVVAENRELDNPRDKKKNAGSGSEEETCESPELVLKEYDEQGPQSPDPDDNRCPYSFSDCPFLEVASILWGE